MATTPVIDAPSELAALGALSIEQMRRTLATERVGFQMYLFGAVGSTNAVLRRLAETGAADGTVVLAEAQTVGRGRLGKPWFSPPGLNLYASVVLRPRIAPSAVRVYSMAASLALTETMWAAGVAAGVKWPNDVVADGRKLAGTLVGYAMAGDRVEYVILGVGVNLNVDRPTLEAGLGAVAAGATSLRELAGHPVDRNAFAAAFLNHLEKWDDEYRTRGPVPLLRAWRARDAAAGHRAWIREPEREFEARVVGIGDDGRLIVDDADNRRYELVDAEMALLG